MATETFTFEYDDSADIFVRIFDTAGQVFDFDDNTWTTLALATTPYKTTTEKTDMGGSTKSGYVTDVDLAIVNDTGAVGRYVAKAYDNATPADADDPVGDPQEFTVQFAKIGERLIEVGMEINVKSTAGSTAQVALWLNHDGVKVSLDSVGGTVFTADHTTETFTSTTHGLSNGDVVTVTTSTTLPTGLSVSTAYYVVNKAASTFELSATAGGAAINITSNGTGTHKWHEPTASVTVREHGGGVNLFTATATAADLQSGRFEVEQASPNFVDDRQYEVVASITENGVTHLTTHSTVVIG